MSDTNQESEAVAASSASTRTSRQSKWDIMFQYLREYTELNGHALVPNRYEPFPPLGAWVSTQRRHYKTYMDEMEKLPTAGAKKAANTPLSAERIQMLESIGFVWSTTDPRHVPWEDRYNELCEYRETYGNCLVPMGYKENPQLANWVSTQRQEWKLLQSGKSCRITQEKISKLDELGFSWEAVRGGKRKKRSAASSESTTEPKKKKSTTKTSSKKTPANKEDGTTPTGTTTIAAVTNAEEAPAPSASNEESWSDMYEALLQFKAKMGNTNVTNRYKDKPGLSAWVVNQRREYAIKKELEASNSDNANVSSSLTDEQVHLLESIGFDFKARKPGRPAKVATAATTSTTSPSDVAAPAGNLKNDDEDEVFADAVEIINDGEQEESAKEEKRQAPVETANKKRVKKNIPKGNPGKVSTEVVGGVKDAAEMLYSLGGA